MAINRFSQEDKKTCARKVKKPEGSIAYPSPHKSEQAALAGLQRQIGNRAVQRLLVQCRGEGAFDLDDETTGRINSQRGGGQALDSGMQAQMSAATGQDFSGVKVHTDAESQSLSQQLEAKAFTTGQDIFFNEGTYQPGSSSGQELLAHELTHVVQQRSGAASGSAQGGGMTVNAPGDVFEQEADSVAAQVTRAGSAEIQRQTEEEAEIQMQEMEEEEEEELG